MGTLDRDSFLKGGPEVEATIWSIVVIGEAANAVDRQLQRRFGDFPWAGVIALRNVLNHQYFQIRYDMIWRILAQDLPRIRGETARMIAVLSAEPEGSAS